MRDHPVGTAPDHDAKLLNLVDAIVPAPSVPGRTHVAVTTLYEIVLAEKSASIPSAGSWEGPVMTLWLMVAGPALRIMIPLRA